MRFIRLLRPRGLFLAVVIAVPTLAGAVALPAWRAALLSAGVAVAGAAVAVRMIAVYVSAGRATPSVFEAALHRPEIRPSRPGDLEALERVLGWRTYEGAEFDHRVRPVLTRIARMRILDRRGIDPAAAPEAAGASVGPALGSLLRDEPTPATLTTRDLDRIVTEIEEVR